MRIPVTKVDKELVMTAKEYAALEAPGDLIPPGVDPDDWHSNRVVASGGDDIVAPRSTRNYVAPGQVCDWGDGTFRLGLSVKRGVETTEYVSLTIPKTDLNDPTDFSSIKESFPPESKVVSLTSTELEIAD